MNFKDKIVLVTGGSRGIGRAIATSFAMSGAAVIITSKTNMNNLDETFNIIKKYNDKCMKVQCDVSDYASVQNLINEVYKHFDHIDILVNNAGISDFGLLTDLSVSRWHEVIDTNLSSMFYMSKLVLPRMISNKSGNIINISSIWGEHGSSYEAVYSISKGGVNAFTKALSKEVAPSNIRVNAISCGLIDTSMNDDLSEDDIGQFCNDHTMLNRPGTAIEVANTCLFLASEDSSYITGQIIGVDGGFM